MKILFLGNSYTYFHDMPYMLRELAKTCGREIETEMITAGGVSYEWHWNNPESISAIETKDWDYVVLQERSLGTVEEPEKMRKFAEKLIAKVRENNAVPILYLTWARQHLPEMQETVTRVYTGIAKEFKVKYAPVGIAWQKALQNSPDLVLHIADRSHPTLLGSYLAACVFYHTFWGDLPEHFPFEYTLPGEKPVAIDEEKAKYLQQKTKEAFTDF